MILRRKKKVEFGENFELQLKIREIYVLYTASCILIKVEISFNFAAKF